MAFAYQPVFELNSADPFTKAEELKDLFDGDNTRVTVDELGETAYIERAFEDASGWVEIGVETDVAIDEATESLASMSQGSDDPQLRATYDATNDRLILEEYVEQ